MTVSKIHKIEALVVGEEVEVVIEAREVVVEVVEVATEVNTIRAKVKIGATKVATMVATIITNRNHNDVCQHHRPLTTVIYVLLVVKKVTNVSVTLVLAQCVQNILIM